ncbi:MAG: ATP-dependent Clp protease ATP-binding subunit [Thermodesulfobacteriota bacterium]
MLESDSQLEKFSENARKVIAHAIEESQRRGHFHLGPEHIFMALAAVEERLYRDIMGMLRLDAHRVLKAVEQNLTEAEQYVAEGTRLAPQARTIFRLALSAAQSSGRGFIRTADLFKAIFQEGHGLPVKVMKSFGIDSNTVLQAISAYIRQHEESEAQIKRRFELPHYLRQFGVNLNRLARLGKLHPIIGRETEIRRMMEILSHKERANSVMIIGDPGVGKSAIVEGLVLKIEYDREAVPPRLRDKQIVNLQMNTVVAGTMFRGMFEDRMEKIINELKERQNIILFVDEAHSLIGTGSALGAPSDAANILKSSLSRGEVQIIGATTGTEYKQYIMEDEALARRFRVVQVDEPSLEETREIISGFRPVLEKNYSLTIANEAIDTALEMSQRYGRSRRLPDKVIGWLDTASVKVEMNRPHDPVTTDDVIGVISEETKIPKDMIYRDVSERFNEMEECLSRRIVGQKEAIRAVCNRLWLNKGPLKENFLHPDGVLLFLGPTGVGKTEMAKALAEFLFGDENKMVRVDMSEYKNSGISVDKLIGMPRGIVGSERGGVLTNQIRDNPYTVLLLDEMEKADPYVLNLFLQVFDEGWLTDGRGKKVYFSDAVIIMTSNLGSHEFKRFTKPMGFLDEGGDFAAIKKAILKEVENNFSPEFINRIDHMIVFSPLTEQAVREIAANYLGKISQKLALHQKTFEVSDQALSVLTQSGYSPRYGARFLKRVIDEKVKVPLTRLWKEGENFQAYVRDGQVVIAATHPAREYSLAGSGLSLRERV